MKSISIIGVVLILLGCAGNNISIPLKEYIKNPDYENVIKQLSELNIIFESFDFSLYTIIGGSQSRIYYLSSTYSINQSYYKNNIIEKIEKNGWVLVELNDYGSLFCDNLGNSLGVTFPSVNERVKGFYTYTSKTNFYLTYEYSIDGKSGGCSDMGYYKNGLVAVKKI